MHRSKEYYLNLRDISLNLERAKPQEQRPSTKANIQAFYTADKLISIECKPCKQKILLKISRKIMSIQISICKTYAKSIQPNC